MASSGEYSLSLNCSFDTVMWLCCVVSCCVASCRFVLPLSLSHPYPSLTYTFPLIYIFIFIFHLRLPSLSSTSISPPHHLSHPSIPSLSPLNLTAPPLTPQSHRPSLTPLSHRDSFGNVLDLLDDLFERASLADVSERTTVILIRTSTLICFLLL